MVEYAVAVLAVFLLVLLAVPYLSAVLYDVLYLLPYVPRVA